MGKGMRVSFVKKEYNRRAESIDYMERQHAVGKGIKRKRTNGGVSGEV